MKPLWHLCKTVCLALEVIKIIYEALHFQQEEMTSAFGHLMQLAKPLHYFYGFPWAAYSVTCISDLLADT